MGIEFGKPGFDAREYVDSITDGLMYDPNGKVIATKKFKTPRPQPGDILKGGPDLLMRFTVRRPIRAGRGK